MIAPAVIAVHNTTGAIHGHAEISLVQSHLPSPAAHAVAMIAARNPACAGQGACFNPAVPTITAVTPNISRFTIGIGTVRATDAELCTLRKSFQVEVG